MDIYHLSHEIEASDMSALGAVISCDEERVKLEKEAEVLAAQVCFKSIKSVVIIMLSSLFLLLFCTFIS
jgi:ATP-binding cassette subfamily F protein 2